MKKILITVLCILLFAEGYGQIKAPGVNWDDNYSFNRSNYFQIEFYASGNELIRTGKYVTHFQLDGENFMVRMITDKRGTGIETIIDKKNEVAIQMFGTGGGAVPAYNAGGYKYPGDEELKKLDIVPSGETRQILGYKCNKYTYTYKKIFGEIWLTDEVKMPNDIGVFRACKMAALHNTLSISGFVMEMTTEDAKGGKTLMKTVSLGNVEDYSVDLRGIEMSTALNKVNYFVF